MFKVTFNDLVIIAMEIHLFPCRTQKLSPSTAEVLGGCPLGDRRVAKFWEFSSAGRASALQAEGQRFDPVNSHWLFQPLSEERVWKGSEEAKRGGL